MHAWPKCQPRCTRGLSAGTPPSNGVSTQRASTQGSPAALQCAMVRIEGSSKARTRGIPSDGYAAFAECLLRGIETLCGVDYLHFPTPSTLTVFTGPIDRFFGFDLGRLGYRAQQRELIWHSRPVPKHPTVQTNFPDLAEPAIRAIEWRHMAPPIGNGTLITMEYPYTPDDPEDFEYPMPTAKDRELYSKYRDRAAREPQVIFAGRLATYRYLDMDQAIGAAMKCWSREIEPRLRS